MTGAVLTVQPVGISLEDWAAQVRIDLRDDNIPAYFIGMDWRDWARRCQMENTFLLHAAPDPNLFQDWRAWAYRVFQTLS